MGSMHFDRPIIILSAPRSGSTLLFETLKNGKDICTIGDESHAVIEHIAKFSTVYRGFESNALTADDVDAENAALLKQRFSDRLIDRHGQAINSSNQDSVRFLEKTPKNALRVGFLNKLFPDALFVYLVRDPRANIASIIDAWISQKFRTYPNLPGFNGKWSLLLPPNWQSMQGKRLEQIASFQWQSANNHILDELEKIDPSRWMMVNYQELLDNPATTVNSILNFAGLAADKVMTESLQQGLPLSQYTLSAPDKNKWHKKAAVLANVMAEGEDTLQRINTVLQGHGQPTLANNIDQALITATQKSQSLPSVTADNANTTVKPVSRNSPCPCGSGQRYKNCHGKLN
ncbi:sulfotransferase family protein [Thalassotalea sp. HSM 43]|uniref:sulfotransferase family protein n=1 Tax=Thalassotalea sp. HSM 43 TaxID=2552945 RepID=UPI001E5ACCE9|nr:sulfotransferase [Thalassotalea sp. HSM 43]